MVNFRYHLVSLIAVFLALGTGVVLGAGPLQNAINMRGEDKGSLSATELSGNLEEMSLQVTQGEEFVWAVADDLLPGALEGVSVAVVALPGTTSSDKGTIARGLELAGADVAGQVDLSSRWVGVSDATYRQTLAAAVSTHLQGEPSDTSAAGILAQGFIEILTTDGTEADLIREMLTDESTALVVGTSLPTTPVEAVVLVGPSQVQESEENAQSGQENDSDGASESWLELALAATSAPGGAVAVGQAQFEDQFIAALRTSDARITTVDQGGTAMSAVNTALALASGELGAYGQQLGAVEPLAPRP